MRENRDDKDKEKKRSEWKLKLAYFFSRYTWVLLLLVIALISRKSFGTLIHTITNWDEVVKERGDLVLKTHIFIRDRLYLEDPQSYSHITFLDSGTLSENIRPGADLTLVQTKFEFNNGDVYRHLEIPYSDKVKLSPTDTLKLVVRYRYPSITMYYLDPDSGKWVENSSVRAGTALPENTLTYFNFDDDYYVLMDRLYAYREVDDGIVESVSDLDYKSYLDIQGGGWTIMTSFRVEEGHKNEFWTLESTEPLINPKADDPLAGLEMSERQFVLSQAGVGNRVRWFNHGGYEAVQEGFTPHSPNMYCLDPQQSLAGLMADLQESRAASELGFIQLYLSSRSEPPVSYYGECGNCYISRLQNTELYENSGIKYGYVDHGKNAAYGLSLVRAARNFEESGFDDAIRQLAEYFMNCADNYSASFWNERGEQKGLIIADYMRYGAGAHDFVSSPEILEKVSEFLFEAGNLLGETEYKAVAEKFKYASKYMGGQLQFEPDSRQ